MVPGVSPCGTEQASSMLYQLHSESNPGLHSLCDGHWVSLQPPGLIEGKVLKRELGLTIVTSFYMQAGVSYAH